MHADISAVQHCYLFNKDRLFLFNRLRELMQTEKALSLSQPTEWCKGWQMIFKSICLLFKAAENYTTRLHDN